MRILLAIAMLIPTLAVADYKYCGHPARDTQVGTEGL